MKLNLDYMMEALWEALQLIRVYTKKPGAPPDFDDGLILRKARDCFPFIQFLLQPGKATLIPYIFLV